MDDGWFGKRNTDHAGLGDWYVNPEEIPHGLKPLIDKVTASVWILAYGSSRR